MRPIYIAFKVCQRSTPNLAQCVKESIESIRPSLGTGNFGNGFVIDGLEPLKIDDIVIQRNGLNANLYNVKANGATTFLIDKLRINVENFKVDAIIHVAKVEAYGQYQLQMKLGVLNIKGDGNAKAVIGEKSFETVEFNSFTKFSFFRKSQSQDFPFWLQVHKGRPGVCESRRLHGHRQNR